jgi:hypothetical protein
MDKALQPHLDAVHRVLRYLKQSLGQGIFLSETSDIHLHVFWDANWARYRDAQCSVT